MKLRYESGYDSMDELYHFKYFKREKINGKWKYWYKKITDKVSKSYSNIEESFSNKTANAVKKVKSVYNSITNDNPSKSDSNPTVKFLVNKHKKKFKYIKKELINGKWRYWYPEDFKKDTSEKGSNFLDKLFGKKESSNPKVEVNNTKGEDEIKLSKKELAEYKASQDKERNGVRKKELEKALEILKKPNTWFKKNNPLPDVKLKKSATTLDEDMRLVNPNYNTSKKTKYDQNCTSCTMAYDLRRRGYDVEAKSESSNTKNGRTVTTISDVANCYKDAEIVVQKDLKKKYEFNNTRGLVKAVEKDMLSHGEGSRGNMVVAWSSGGGHSVSWEVENGKVVVRDCQSGKKRSLDDYSGRISDMCYMRTDNLEVNDNVQKYVRNRKGD